MSLDLISGDRRRHRRYIFELPLRFRWVNRAAVASEGHGETVDLSHGGILFRSESPPPIGSTIEARITWPFLLQGVCRLELVVHGSISQVSNRGIVLALRTYEFQTFGERSFVEGPALLGEVHVA